ncbi:LAMI_0G14158g1_1 [Lachancea mirantina]|uniref:LAMI_0G14158g1_1 n=1 Tax=Lachancea mirantina TaxID=1230905 RepID=A0A1G4KC20_9SACH|nr:LAMI_0G14158g1_1 [Lachancea mirantina]
MNPLVCTFLTLRCVWAAGVGVHLTVLARTLLAPQDELFSSSLRAGAFFPDALYSCGTNSEWHDFAEDCHWPNFLVKGVKLWHERYDSQQLSPGAQKLKSFLIGVLTHQVVDVSWHSLVENYRSHGLIKVLAGLEFDGIYEKAHNYADTFGDLLVLAGVVRDGHDDWLFYTEEDWELPEKKDLMELVHRMGLYSIDFWGLDACVRRGKIAMTTEIYSLLERRRQVLTLPYGLSPRARELIQEHWMGGEFDCAAMVNKCLGGFLALFEPSSTLSDTEILNKIRICATLPETEGPYGVEDSVLQSTRLLIQTGAGDMLLVSPLKQLSRFGASMKLGRFLNGEICLAVGAPLEDSRGSVYVIPWRFLVGENRALGSLDAVNNFYGDSVECYTVGEIDFLAVTDSGGNSVHFYLSGSEKLVIVDSDCESHHFSLSCVQKLFDDDVPALIFSDPYYGFNETGKVYIVDGHQISNLLVQGTRQETVFSSLNKITLELPKPLAYQHFGSQVASSCGGANQSGFLYLSAQGLGIVLMYDLAEILRFGSKSSPRYVLEENKVLPWDEGALLENRKIKPSNQHGMFGKEVLTWVYEEKKYTAISQHLQNMVYIFREFGDDVKFHMKVALDTATELANIPATIGFGAGITYDTNQERLLISSPGSFNAEGAIWNIAMRDIAEAAEKWRLPCMYVTIPKNLLVTGQTLDKKGVIDFGKILLAGPDSKVIIGIPNMGYGNMRNNKLIGGFAIV